MLSTDQVTPVLEEFDTVAVKDWPPPVGTLAELGARATLTGAGPLTTVTAEESRWFVSAVLVFPLATPSTSQVTPVFDDPDTAAAKVLVPPTLRLAVAGVSVTLTESPLTWTVTDPDLPLLAWLVALTR